MPLEVGFHGQIFAAQPAEVRVGNPGQVPENQNRLGQIADDAAPIRNEEIRFGELDPIIAPTLL